MKIGILQQNYIVGDCVGNTRLILEGYKKLCSEGAELVVGSELAILGYPPKDLLESDSKLDEEQNQLWNIIAEVGNVGLIVGVTAPNIHDGKPLFNQAVLIRDWEEVAARHKELLPTYDVFDESRYFKSGSNRPCIVKYNGKRIGILICEDIWNGTEDPTGRKLYSSDPVQEMVERAPDIVIVINASPYYWGKGKVRYELVSEIAQRLECPVVYVNQVGGNDDLIFDGRSFAVNAEGRCIGAAKPFEEAEMIFDTEAGMIPGLALLMDDHQVIDELYNALVLGVRDYLRKTGFTKVVIGESGGIDSALTTCIAVDAVGANNVTAIGMPSDFSSEGSVRDSKKLCDNLGVKFEIIPIGDLYDTFGDAVGPVIGWRDPKDFDKDVTEENVQARLRGAILMAYSNRNKSLVLSTGNKSELAVGYCTLYGDMVGGLSVISDVPKTLVYDLADYRNRNGEVIPRQIIEKAPSAELRPEQKDQDSLPPYEVLDAILHFYVEEGLGQEVVIQQGFGAETVAWVISKVDANEYKRRQSAPGLKVTAKAFGSGRRIPIAIKPRPL